MTRFFTTFACACALLGCGGGSGGSTATGGSSAHPGSGGANATGGAGTGGSSGQGGSTATGGTGGSGLGTGGATPTAGTAGTGGAAGQAAIRGAGPGGAAGSAGSRGGAGGTAGGGGGNNAATVPLVPAHGALLGAFVGTGTLAGFESALGRKVAVNHLFMGWGDDWTAQLAGLAAGGRIPMVTWEPWTAGSVGAPLANISGGSYDAMITARANASKSFGQEFFLRWGHEMNGNWYPWDGSHNGANAAAATKYIAAYRHIHDLFVAAGATNVVWIFCPNVDSVPGDAWNQWTNYYPGDTYADWLGVDGYNWGTVQTGSTWRTFSAMFGSIYSSLAAKGKPIIIPETASAEQGGDKSAWIAAVLPALQNSFPAIKALVWFQMNKETDWRADSSPAALSAFTAMAKDPYFNP